MRKNNIGTRSIKGKRFVNLRRRVLSAAIIAASQTAWVTPAIAGPDGGHVVGGDGSIGRDGRNTTIHQRSDRMAIDWDSYNVAADEVVTYIQPGRESVALNRILSHNGSEIHGQINANGQVVLVNPHGVFFGKDAQVNVGGLIASGMTVDVSDFMNGDFAFSAMKGAEGKVINQGLINAATGGSVTLLGKQVRNDGLISARLGAVNLAAGKEAVVTFDEAGLMGVRISKEILQDELGVDAAVLNTGEITAQGGRILLSASTSRDIFSQAVNRGDLEQATSAVVHEDGSFTLGGGADVVNTGTLNVSSADRGAGDIVVLGENITQAGTVLASTQSGTSGIIELHAAHTALLTEESFTAARAEGRGQGGQIKVLGHHVGLTDQATVDASGAWGGGQVYIGGDYQGDNPFMPNAWRSFVGEQTHIKVNALAQGDGGRIIVWADDITRFFGSIEGKGAGENGTGGFAEVSGKNQLRFDGLADMRGPGGVGTLLLDPRDIIIADSTDEDNVGPDVSFDGGDSDQDFLIRNSTLANNLNTADVQLEATRNITVEDAVNVNAESENDLTLLAGNNINIESQINLGRGNLYLTAGVFNCGDIGCYPGDDVRSVEITGILNTRGTIDIRAADDIKLAERIGNSGLPAAVSLRAGNNITITNAGHISVSAAPDTTAISLIAGDTTLATTIDPVPGGDGNLVIGGDLNSYGTADARGGNIFLNSSGELTLNADVMTQGGHFTVGESEGVRPNGFSMVGHAINTGTANRNSGGDISRYGTGLDAGNIAIYTDGSADLGTLLMPIYWESVDAAGGAHSVGSITVAAGEDITLHADLNFNDFGPRTGAGLGGDNLENSTFHLTAGRDITLDGKIYDTPLDGRDALDIELEAGERLTLNKGISTSGGSISLEAGTEITLGNVVTEGSCQENSPCVGNLTLRGRENSEGISSPNISQKDDSHLQIAGTTTINIGTGIATLNSSDNRFLGPINGVAQNLTVSGGDDGLTFGALTLTGNLTATATGNITDITDGDADNIIRVDGLATFNTSENSLFLASRAHQLSAVDIVGNVQQVTLKNSRSLEVGAITTTGEGGAVDIETVGDLTVSDAISTLGRNGSNGGWPNPGVDGQHGGAIRLSASGALTVGKLDADGGARRISQALGLDGGDITLEADQVILQGDISSRGSEGDGSNLHGTSGNITITGNTVIDPSGKDTIIVDNTGSGGPETHSGVFKLDGTLNGVYRPGDDEPDDDGSGDDPAEVGLFTNLTINSSDVTLEGSIGNSTALGNLTINTYGDVDFGSQSFPNASSIQVTGLAGDNTLRAPDVAGEWRITASGGGRLSAASGGTTSIEFSNMSTLVGSSFSDRFTIATGDDIDLSIIGNRDEDASNGTATNTLVGADRENHWSITSAGGGMLNGRIQFQDIDSLVGGTNLDQFVLSGWGSVSQIDGGELGVHGPNTVQLEEGVNRSFSIGLGAPDTDIQLVNIGNVRASASDGHVLIGANQTNKWLIDDENAGKLNDQVDFTGFTFLRGNGADDTFVIVGDGVITGNIDGGDEGDNTLDLSGVTTDRALTIALRDTDDADFILRNINTVNSRSGADHTFVADHQTNTWSITGTNTGEVAGVLFNGMANLVGGQLDDTFVFTAAGDITGLINGGGHETENTLDYSRVPGIDIALGDDNDFINIQHLIGDNNNSTLRAADQNNEWLLTGGVNAGTLNDDLRFTGITNLVGGAEHDVFTVNGGTLTGSIKAGKGSSSLYLTIGSGANGRLRFLGGEGNDQVEINGGGENYQAHYTIDGAGQESLSYITGANGTSYDLLYQGVAEVQDNVYADKLTLQASSPTDEMVLGGNRFHAPGYSELHFNNKHNLTLAASSQNHIKLDGLIDIPGTFEVQNALVTQSNDQARIEARHLILTSIAGFGAEDQPVHTRVERANIRLGRADLYLRNHGDLSLNELTGSGTVSIQSEGMLNSAADLSLSGFASFVSHQGDITLAGDNLLSGEISLAAAGNITLRNQNDSRLQRVQADSFTLTSKGDITAPGVLTVNGLTTLRADGDITLLNDSNQLNELDVQQAENVTVHAGHWLDLGHVYSSGDVYTRTQGLSLSDRLTANSFRFDAGQQASVIDGRLNVSTLTGKAQGITVRQAISVDQMELDSRGGTLELNAELETLQNLTLRGTNIEQNAALFSGAELRVSSDANYRQRANIASAEDLWITASGDIIMESGALSHTHSGQIRYQAGNDIALSSLDAGGSTVSLTADRGSISNNNGSDINVFADQLEMSAGAGIGRAAALTTDIRVLDAQSQSGRLAVVNQGELQVDRMASNGNVRLSNRTGDIYLNNQDGPVFNTAESDARLAGGTLNGNYNLGTVVVEVADGSLYGLGQAHAHKPDLVGREVIMLAPNGTVGSRGRPLVVYAKDLSSTIAGHTWPMWWAFDVRPSQVENDSGIPQELLDFASAGSHQMVEVESLEDINPAIFTEVRNYTYSHASVLLPPDQRYDDEGDQ